jgi:hypothetical protein
MQNFYIHYCSENDGRIVNELIINNINERLAFLTLYTWHDNINLALRAAEADRIYRVDSSRPR